MNGDIRACQTYAEPSINGIKVAIHCRMQWIPAHCGLRGNELADTLAKQGAHLEQIDSTTTYSEEKTIIKSCLKRKWKLEHPKYNKADAYNQLERHEQVVIFRLRTNHNKLKQHLYRTFKVGDTD